MSEHAPVCDHPLFTYQPAWAHGGHGALVGHATHNAHLPVSPAALWTVLSDPRTWSDWLTVHQRWAAPPRAQFVPGARMTAETSMLGVATTVEWTVDSAIAPGTLVLIGTGEAGLRTRLTFLVTPTEGGARLTVTSEIAGDLLTEPVVSAIERDGAQQLAHSVDMLAALASEPSAPRRPALRLVHSAPAATSAAPTGTRRLRAVR